MIVVKKGFFSGAKNVHGPNGLEAIVRGMATDNAKIRMAAATIAALTDNSTGVAGSIVDVHASAPTGRFNATTSGGTQTTGLNMSLIKVKNAEAVFANDINALRTALGLAPITNIEGTAATAHTVPALDKVANPASGNGSASYSSYHDTVKCLKDNQRKLIMAFDDVAVACGQTPLVNGIKGNLPKGLSMEATPAVVSSVSGSNSVALADANAMLVALANNYATLAARFNAIFAPNTGSIHTVGGLSVLAGA